MPTSPAPAATPVTATTPVTTTVKVSKTQQAKSWYKKNRITIWRIAFFSVLALIALLIYWLWPKGPDEFEQKLRRMRRDGYTQVRQSLVSAGNNRNFGLGYIGRFTVVTDTSIEIDTYRDLTVTGRHSLVSGHNTELGSDVTSINFLAPIVDVRFAILINPK